ncbi:S8 family serine peptidase [bacterium]|nr:S8 family serine peptidase [bacterium]
MKVLRLLSILILLGLQVIFCQCSIQVQAAEISEQEILQRYCVETSRSIADFEVLSLTEVSLPAIEFSGWRFEMLDRVRSETIILGIDQEGRHYDYSFLLKRTKPLPKPEKPVQREIPSRDMVSASGTERVSVPRPKDEDSTREREVLSKLEFATQDRNWDEAKALLSQLPARKYGDLIERFQDQIPHERPVLLEAQSMTIEEERQQSSMNEEYESFLSNQALATRKLQDVPSGDDDKEWLEQTPVAGVDEEQYNKQSKAIRGVGSGCTYATLQAAVDAAVSGDDIYIAIGTYNQTVNVYNKSLNFYGGASSDCSSLTGSISTIDGTGLADSVFEIYGDTTADTVLVQNLDIINGEADANYGGGLEIDNNTVVNLVNTWIYNNESGYGGGVHLSDGSVFDMNSGSRIYNNSATGDGGGIYCQGGTVYIRGNSNYVGVSGYGNVADSDSNNTGNGGGIYLDGGTAYIYGSSGIGRVTYNQAENGGGIYALNSALIYLEGTNALIGYNDANFHGGGIYLASGADIYVTSASINNNHATSYAGGVYVTGSGSSADFDVMAACSGKCCQLSHNTAGSRAAGAYVSAGAELDLEMVYMENNSNSGLGSAIYALGSGTLVELDSVMITGNTTTSDYLIRLFNSGGAPYARVRNTTIAGNLGQSQLLGIDDRIRLEAFGLIVWGNNGTMLTGEGDVTIDSSILSEEYPGSNNLVSDPLFLDAAAGNYHISKNSPAVDHCNGLYSIDVDYEARPHDIYGIGSKGPIGTNDTLADRIDPSGKTDHIVRVMVDECPLSELAATLTSITRLVDYGSWLWLELNQAEYAALKASGLKYEDIDHYGIISFGNYYFDPIQDGEPLFQMRGLTGSPENANGYGLHLVQLRNPLTESDQALLEHAVVPINYVTDNTYLVWADQRGLERLRQSPLLRWDGAFHRAYRLGARLELDRAQYPDNEYVKLNLSLLDDGTLDRIEDWLERNAGEILNKAPRHVMGEGMAMLVWQIEVLGDMIEQLTSFANVVHIMISYPSLLDDESSDQIIADNASGGIPVVGYNNWLTTTGYNGSGVKVAIVDGGVDWDHVDLNVVSGTEYGGYEEVGEPGSDGGAGDGSGHGTHVAGIVNANGTSGLTDGTGFLYGLGVAPGTTLHAQDALGDGPAVDIYTRSYDSITNGADLSNNSWYYDCPLGGCGYTGNCADLDDYVHDAISGSPRNPFMLVFSAGNAGNDCGGPYPCMESITDPKEAKNVIVVGSTDSERSASGDIDAISDFSSRGFCVDGRVKPDVMAPGDNIISTENRDGLVDMSCDLSPAGTTTHAYCSGTSMSSPHVTGFAALFIEFWRVHYYTSSTPLPATINAAIICTTDDLGGADDGWGHVITNRPNEHQGWGRVNMDRLLNPPVPIQFYENPLLLDDSGDYYEIQIQAYNTSEPLRITLAWTDAPGLADANPALVNNLNLRVTDPNSTYWRGNYFGTDGWSQSGGSYDTLNNIENVWIENPIAGTYTLRVTGTTIAGDGYYYNGDTTDQHFSLVCYNCEQVQAGQYDAGADEAYALVGVNGAVCEYGTIADAVAAASSGSTIYIPSGTYIERIGTINKDLTFVPATDNCSSEDLAATSSSVIVDNNAGFASNGGIAYITSSADVTFRHMTLRDASATYGGILWANTGTSTLLDDADVSNGVASSIGGGIRSLGTVELINDSEVINNETTGTGYGGGVSIASPGTLIMRNASRVGDYLQANNSVTQGGGVYLDGSSLEMYDTSRIRSNVAITDGGGVYAYNGADVILNNNAYIGYLTTNITNEAVNGAGIFLTGPGSTLTMNNNSAVVKNVASGDGGGIYAAAGAVVTLAGTAHIGSTTADYGNGADNGAGLYLTGSGSSLNMSGDSSVRNNIASDNGGGINVNDSALALIDSAVIDSNTAGYYGGGIYCDGFDPLGDPSLTVQNATAITNNTAMGGAGIYVMGGSDTVLLDNSLIDNNTASFGGGFRLNGNGTVTMQNGMTITNNDATVSDGGGLLLSEGGTFDLTDTTLQYNTAIGNGGAISSSFNAANVITLTDCDIRWNSADLNGGGINNETGTVSCYANSDMFVLGVNIATDGGGLYDSSGNTVRLHATHGNSIQFNTNIAANNGGGAYITNGSLLDIYGQVSITSNTAVNNGGALYVDNATLWLDDYSTTRPEILVNTASNSNGGGIYAQDSTRLEFDGALIGGGTLGNQAPNGNGGGMYLNNSVANLDDVTLQNNTCATYGGGIYAVNGSTISIYASMSTPTKDDGEAYSRPGEKATACNPALLAADRYCSEVRNNIAGSAGGGIYLNNGSSLDAVSTAFMANQGVGAALYSYSATDSVTIRNCRFSDNTGTNAARFWLTETVLLENNTFADNSTNSLSVNSASATSTFNNNIFWDGSASIINGTILGSCNNSQHGEFPGISQAPLFETTSRGDYHLGLGSPCIDACTSGYAADLDNVARPKNGDGAASSSEYDMGAFEHGDVSAAPPPPTPDGDNVPGTPVEGQKLAADGSQIRITWDVLTCPADQYLLLYGNLSTVSGYANSCIDNIDPDENGSYDWLTVPSTNTWFVIVSSSGIDVEGSWGTNSSNIERDTSPAAPSACSASKDTSGTCP